jgi:uncharacterized protein YndB with AHSA1/START domain
MASILSPTERELVITRLVNAPRELVFKAWTNPRLAIKWWEPRDYPATHMDMDARPGGTWRHCLTSTETGQGLWQHGVFREVVAPERLVFTFVWEEEGERGIETLVTITFANEGGKTRLTLRQKPFQSVEERDSHGYGWNSSVDRLEEHLAASASQ